MTTTRTTRLLQLLLAVIYLLLLASGVRANDTALVQGAIDLACMPGQSRVVDLGDRVYSVRSIRIGTQHNGLRVVGSKWIVCLPDFGSNPRYGVFELRKTSGAPLNATFDGLNFAGMLTDYTDDCEVNRERSRRQGMWAAAILCHEGSRVDSLTIRNCSVRRLAAGFQPNDTIRFKCHYCFFEQVATNCIISIVPHGNDKSMIHDVLQVTGNECGSGFNFGGAANVPVIPLARVRSSTFTNTLGRTKISGYWYAEILRTRFIQNRLIPNRFYGLSVPCAHEVMFRESEISGFLAGGIESSGWTERPTIEVQASKIAGGQIAVNSSAWTHVSGTTISDVVLPWGGSTTPASVIDTTIHPARSVARQANLFVGATKMVETWNRLHGTQYDASRWWYLLPEVRAAMGVTQ